MAKQETNQVKVRHLLMKLEKETDKREKQGIRKELRSLGHRGGLGKKKHGAKKKTKKAKAKKVTKKKAKAKAAA